MKHEFWVIRSETHLEPGSLAYWGPYSDHDSALDGKRRLGGEDSIIVTTPVTEIRCAELAKVEGIIVRCQGADGHKGHHSYVAP